LKIVHLVTSTTGGAAQAAIRSHEALLCANHNSNIFSIERRIEGHSNEIVKKLSTSSITRITSSVTTVIQQKAIQKGSSPVSPISLDLLNWGDTEIQRADVLHLHAFYNLVSVRDFLRKFPHKKKVVTLHDERFFTGGCHYQMDCEQLNLGCQRCPQVRIPYRPLVARQRKSVLQLVSGNLDVTFVCPSLWMMQRAMNAFPEFPKSHFVQIYNPIPTNSTVTNQRATRERGINFGFVSQNLDNPIKNLGLLLGAFKEVSSVYSGRHSLTLVGESNSDYSIGNPKISQKVATSSLELQKIFSMMDVLIVPSTHDNLPNVMGEALMSGVGLIGSNVGGIPEIVKLFRQSLFDSGDTEGLVQAMQNFKLVSRAHLNEQAESVFGYQAIATKLGEVYSSSPY
jgi:glycosyltransferase involved in cell wall biosynthesis